MHDDSLIHMPNPYLLLSLIRCAMKVYQQKLGLSAKDEWIPGLLINNSIEYPSETCVLILSAAQTSIAHGARQAAYPTSPTLFVVLLPTVDRRL
jgi:hypothetical protein